MATISMDLRERILAAYDRGDVTREQVAMRFEVSLGFVKKLIQQRRHTGEIAPRHHLSGRKPKILVSHRREMKKLLAEKPDMTLEELRAALELDCTLPAIHYALEKMGLTYKKRHSGPASKIAKTSPRRGVGGDGAKAGSIRPSLSSSTNQRRKRT